MRRHSAGTLILMLTLGAVFAAAPAAPADGADSLRRVQAVCAAAATTATAQGKSRGRDLELFVLAEARESLGADPMTAQLRLYLKTYFPDSPWLRRLPPLPEDTPVLDNVELDPEWSRLVRAGVRLSRAAAPDESWQTWFKLVQIQAKTPQQTADSGELREFLAAHPAAPLSGWAALQLLWEDRELFPGPKSAEEFREFWAQHPGHPLGAEASEALDVPWFPPEHVAHLSAILPGWGEETLEPGLHASSQALFAETVYLLGAVSFWAASQSRSRAGNLTGGLIFFNLLMLNHRGSAEQAYTTALQRNAAERRKFLNERLDRELAGSGRFSPAAPEAPPAEALAQDLVVGVSYRLHNAGDAWRGRSLVRDEQLDNLGLTLDWVQSLWDSGPAAWQAGVGLMPHAQLFGTRAQGLPDAPFVSDVNVSEYGGALEAVGLLRWTSGGPWLQLRLGAGPGYRQRTVDGSGFAGTDAGQAWFGSAVISLGGEGGVYWQVGYSVDDSFRETRVVLPDRELALPSRGEEIQFGLGVRF